MRKVRNYIQASGSGDQLHLLTLGDYLGSPLSPRMIRDVRFGILFLCGLRSQPSNSPTSTDLIRAQKPGYVLTAIDLPHLTRKRSEVADGVRMAACHSAFHIPFHLFANHIALHRPWILTHASSHPASSRLLPSWIVL